MMRRPNVVVVLARCERRSSTERSAAFGVRIEERDPGHWHADWAFALAEKAGVKEGYDKTEIAGRFNFAPGYPGCPWCEARAIVQCGCGRVACWDARTGPVRCPWCGDTSSVDGEIDRLAAGGDR